MRASELKDVVKFSIKNKYPLLIKGAPGIGKSDIVEQACREVGAELIVSHPIVSDPTDYKGLPYPSKDGTKATFLPFGDLQRLIEADKPTVFFLDDLGQSSSSVQASAMHLLLARRINGHKISKHVVFLAATNRRKDKAAVQGILEPVKSRFSAIVELDVNTNDWVDWAIENNLPAELIGFIRFRPNLLHDFKPTADILNSPSPRTIAYVGKMLNAGLPANTEYEMIAGAAGESFAAEFLGFLKIYRDLPDIKELIANPKAAKISDDPSTLFAICGALARNTNRSNFAKVILYTDRLPGEFQVLVIKDAIKRNHSLSISKAFTQWAAKHSDFVL